MGTTKKERHPLIENTRSRDGFRRELKTACIVGCLKTNLRNAMVAPTHRETRTYADSLSTPVCIVRSQRSNISRMGDTRQTRRIMAARICNLRDRMRSFMALESFCTWSKIYQIEPRCQCNALVFRTQLRISRLTANLKYRFTFPSTAFIRS